MNAWAVIGLVWIGAALALGLIVGKVIARGESTDWDALAKLMKSAAIRERAELRAWSYDLDSREGRMPSSARGSGAGAILPREGRSLPSLESGLGVPAELDRQEKGAGPGRSSEGLWFPPVPPRGRAGD